MTLVSISKGRQAIAATLPVSVMSAEVIRIYLDDHEGPIGIAVHSGLMDFALLWGRRALAETTLVPAGNGLRADGLARYARHAP